MDIRTLLLYVICYIGLFSSFMFLSTYFENRKRMSNPRVKRIPFISIIVPAYNEEGSVAKTIDSLLAVDYPRDKIELIVVDDGSTDETLARARRYVKEGVKVFTKKNGGKASALNYGLTKARGELIAALDADSFVEPSALKKMVGYFDDPHVAAVAPSVKIAHPKTFIERVQHIEFLSATLIRKLFTFLGGVHIIPGPLSMFRKSYFDEHGGWSEETITEDLELCLRIESSRKYIIENALDASVYTLPAPSFKVAYRQRLRWFKGLIDNFWEYRHMFSPRYGNMGVFVLPVSVLSLSVALIAFMYSMVMMVVNVANNLYKLSLVGYDLSSWFDFTLDPFFLDGSGEILLLILLFALTVFMVYLARRYDESPDTVPLSFVYFIVSYWFISSVCWLSAASHKVVGKSVRWNYEEKAD